MGGAAISVTPVIGGPPPHFQIVFRWQVVFFPRIFFAGGTLILSRLGQTQISRPLAQPVSGSHSAVEGSGDKYSEARETSTPLPRRGMRFTEKAGALAGLGAAGALSGTMAVLMTANSASQLQYMPHFSVIGGLCGCALAGVMIVGES